MKTVMSLKCPRWEDKCNRDFSTIIAFWRYSSS